MYFRTSLSRTICRTSVKSRNGNCEKFNNFLIRRNIGNIFVLRIVNRKILLIYVIFIINIFHNEINRNQKHEEKIGGLKNKDNIHGGYMDFSLSGVLAWEFQLLKASSPPPSPSLKCSRVKNKRGGRSKLFIESRGGNGSEVRFD